MKCCSYYSASETSADQIKIKEQSAEYTVVLDDLQNLTDTTERENYFEVIRKLLSLNNVWLILIARCPFPRWLLPLRTKYIFAEIEESDFLFSLDEQITYIEQYDIHLTREEHQKAWNLGGGNALSLLFFVMEKGNLELTQRRQWDYLETHVYDQWDLELQEFFMDISIVETFTVRLASMLTGRSDVEKLIFRAEEVGNFFDIRGTDGIWKCRWPMRKSMQQRLRRKRSIEQINHLYYTAGLYYELEEKPLEALSMYEKYNDMESISRLLISNVRKNPSSGHFYELRKYYLKLPEELISGSPVLMAGNVGYTLSCEVDSKYSDFYLGTSKDSMLGSTTGTLKTAENTAVDNAPSKQLTIYPGGSLPAGTNDANVATLTITIGAK